MSAPSPASSRWVTCGGPFEQSRHLSPAALALGEWDRSLKYCRRAIEHGTTLNDVRQRVIGLWRLGLTYSYQGDPERGAQYCSEALALGPLPYDAATAKGAHGYAEIRAGRVDAGIADLREAVAWLDTSNLRFPRWRFSLLLSEGHLRGGDRTRGTIPSRGCARTEPGHGLPSFRGHGMLVDGRMPRARRPQLLRSPMSRTRWSILERIGARNDLARAMVTRAALRQAAGDVATARALLDQAAAIFQALGTLDEPARVEAARAALDHGAPIGLLGRRILARGGPKGRSGEKSLEVENECLLRYPKFSRTRIRQTFRDAIKQRRTRENIDEIQRADPYSWHHRYRRAQLHPTHATGDRCDRAESHSLHDNGAYDQGKVSAELPLTRDGIPLRNRPTSPYPRTFKTTYRTRLISPPPF